MGTLLVVFFTMSPLMSIAIYYNIFFSARQCIRLRDTGLIVSPVKVGWLQSQAFPAFGASFITIVALIACFMLDGLSLHLEAAGPLVGAVFVGISALKIPHVIALSTLPPLRGKHAEA